MQWQGGKRRNRVHDEQGPQFIRHFAKAINLCQHAGGRFAVCQPDHFDLPAFAGTADVFGVHRLAVRRFNSCHFGRGSAANLIHALGKHAVHGNDGFIAFFQDIDDRGFNSARTGS